MAETWVGLTSSIADKEAALAPLGWSYETLKGYADFLAPSAQASSISEAAGVLDGHGVPVEARAIIISGGKKGTHAQPPHARAAAARGASKTPRSETSPKNTRGSAPRRAHPDKCPGATAQFIRTKMIDQNDSKV